MKKILLLVLCAFIALNSQTFAQPFVRSIANKKELPPSFVLVQLNTGTNKIKHLTKTNRKRDLEIAKRDIKNMMQKMILDFDDNFSFCPVYYFYDTNHHLVIQQKFEGILLNAEREIVDTVKKLQADTSYFIIQYGKIINDEEWNSYKIVASNWQSKKLPYPVPETYYQGFMPSKTKKARKEYKYRSSLFELRYKPMAEAYSSTLIAFYYYHTTKHKKIPD